MLKQVQLIEMKYISSIRFSSSLQTRLTLKTPAMSHATYDLNYDILVHYSSQDLNNGPFNDQMDLDHLNTELVHYSDLPVFKFNNLD